MKKILLFAVLYCLAFLFPNGSLAQVTTDANFKVAFIGDSGAGSGFQTVLDLIKQEGAQMVLHQGDFDYDDGPQLWMDKINNTLGANFPYLGSDGNHDNWDTDGYAPFFKNKLTTMGISNTTGALPTNFAFVHKGLKVVMVKENGDPAFIQGELTGDNHTWKICSWHKNMAAMQVGGKGDEQGWPDYEECRKLGAIIATAHEHSYQRTKTLTNTQSQTVDTSCSDPKNLCVAPNRTFVFVSGLGGKSIRNQDRCMPAAFPYGCKGEWASVYTSDQGANYGALFITFNYQGNPNKAHGYFKNVDNQTIDEFDILATSGGSGTTPTAGISQSPMPTGPVQSPTPSVSGKPGDSNGDGSVDGVDYVVWLNNFEQSVSGSANGDFNNSGLVDGIDYVIWLNNYGK